MASRWLPGERRGAAGAGRALSTGPDRPAGLACRVVRDLHALRDGAAFWKTARRAAGHRRGVRPRRRRRRHQRPGGGLFLPAGAARRAHPRARQPRRLRRPRQAQRVHATTAAPTSATAARSRSTARSPTARWPRRSSPISASTSPRYGKVLDSALYKSLGLRPGTFFDKETFGADRLVVGDVARRGVPRRGAVQRGRQARPRAAADREDRPDARASRRREKKARLARISYKDFVVTHLKLDPGVLWPSTRRAPMVSSASASTRCRRRMRSRWACPGFDGMGLDDKPGPGRTTTRCTARTASNYYFHFPDGNATVARLLVRRLVPGAIPGTTTDDIVTAGRTTPSSTRPARRCASA